MLWWWWGLVTQPDMDNLRIETGEIKAKQIRDSGAGIVVSLCENCHLQLDSLNEKYEMGIQITSLMDLVVDALILSPDDSEVAIPVVN